MPPTKKKPELAPAPQSQLQATAENGSPSDVLTLSEAAVYLRLSEVDVLRLVDEQALPARRLGNEWRFLKAAVQQWLGTPLPKGRREGIWAAAGSWKDDPYLDEMLKEIYRRRSQPMTEE